MASGGATESSIACASASLSPPSSPPDPFDEAAPRLKNAWSQVVRGSSSPARSKADPHPDEWNEKLHPLHLSPGAHPRVSDSTIKENPPSGAIAAVVKASPISSCDGIGVSREVACDVPFEVPVPIASPDIVINESAPLETKAMQQSPVKSPKPAWGKLASNAGLKKEPEPVMGAVSWPALSEARSAKASEPTKALATQKATSKSSPTSGDRHQLQAPPLLNREGGGTHQTMPTMMNQKSLNQVMENGKNLPDSMHTNASLSSTAMRAIDADQLKRSGAKEIRAAASESHQRANAANHVSSHDNTRSLMWDQGRGNHSFPVYGRGYANARDGNIPAHHQRGGNRNLAQPFVPFVTPNPGFVHPAGFQNVSGSMYYIPAPASEPILGATYFVPPAVQGVLMHGPDPVTLQSMVVKQIEYYFSVENLCRDIYLRSKMDEQGFVPVSVIANFNRVRMITQNPFLIIEALRMSNAVEIQGDKVRKKGDWANWLLPVSQQSAGFSSPVREGDHINKFLWSPQKAEGADHCSNGVGHSKAAAQLRENISESHLLSDMKSHSVVEDPPQQEVSSFDDGRAGVSLEVDCKHFTQSCSVESGHSTDE